MLSALSESHIATILSLDCLMTFWDQYTCYDTCLVVCTIYYPILTILTHASHIFILLKLFQFIFLGDCDL